MTEVEVFELTSHGGGLAVNCYVEPVYAMDAHFVVPAHWPELQARLAARLNGRDSQLRFEFTTDARYENFPVRATRQTALGESVTVASVEDAFQR